MHFARTFVAIESAAGPAVWTNVTSMPCRRNHGVVVLRPKPVVVRGEAGQHAFRVRTAIGSDQSFHRYSFQILGRSVASSVLSYLVENQGCDCWSA